MTHSIQELWLIDDFSDPQRASSAGRWQYVSDTVMGGVSQGTAEHRTVQGRPALELSGTVSLDNNGGFIQAALDLAPDSETAGEMLDASAATGIAVSICGDGGRYAMNLRTGDTHRPWQSYRHPLATSREWTTHYLPFSQFVAHRIEQALNPRRLRRIGLIAIGNPGAAQVALSRLALYR